MTVEKTTGRGGARPGSGRKAKNKDVQQLHTDTPLVLIEGMQKAGIKNRTAYINFLITQDLLAKTADRFKPGKRMLTELESLHSELLDAFN